MKESIIYQDIKAKGREEGIQQGIQREANLVLRQLNRRLGPISSTIEEQVRQLPIEKLEDLGEELLDFGDESELVNWLSRQTRK